MGGEYILLHRKCDVWIFNDNSHKPLHSQPFFFIKTKT